MKDFTNQVIILLLYTFRFSPIENTAVDDMAKPTFCTRHFAQSGAHGRIQHLYYYVFASIIHTKSGFSESTVVDERSVGVSSTAGCTTNWCPEFSLSKIGLADDACRWQNIKI